MNADAAALDQDRAGCGRDRHCRRRRLCGLSLVDGSRHPDGRGGLHRRRRRAAHNGDRQQAAFERTRRSVSRSSTKAPPSEAAKAFSSGQVDVAIVRSDVGDLSAARTVVLLSHGVALLIVPPGSTIEDIAGLKGKTIGVVGLDVNRGIVDAIDRDYDLTRSKTQFKNLWPFEVGPALQQKQIQALLVVMPITEKYLTLLRSVFSRSGKQTLKLIPIDSAGAIAALNKCLRKLRIAERLDPRLAGDPGRRPDNIARAVLSRGQRQGSRRPCHGACEGGDGDTARFRQRVSAAFPDRCAQHRQGRADSSPSWRCNLLRRRRKDLLRQVRRHAVLRVDAARHAGIAARRALEVHGRKQGR